MAESRELSYNDANIAEFRSSGGKIASFGNAPLLLLTTIGAKTGEQRTSPMMYLADDTDPDRVYVFASKAGADTNPAWFHNLVAHPDVQVEIGDTTRAGRAEVLPETERAAVYAVQAGRYHGFAEYQEKTSRRIPVIALNLES